MEQAEIKQKLSEIVKKQKSKRHHIALDITLFNGNITLSSFRLFEFDETKGNIKGMTMIEEYKYIREDREPVFAYFNISEIADLETSTSNYLFLNESMHTHTQAV